MKNKILKLTKSISIAIILFLVNMASSPVPALAESVSDTFSDSSKINTTTSSGYQVTGGNLQLGAGNVSTANYSMNSTHNGQGLVGWWKFDETTNGTCTGGKDACDSSGNGLHGTQTSTTIVDGVYGKGRSGNGGYVTVSDNAALKPSQITFEMWIKTYVSADHIFLYKYGPSPYQGYGLLVFGGTQGGKAGCWVGGGSWVLSDQSVNNGDWHHIACTTDGSSTTIYVDGVATSPVAQTAALSDTANLRIGAGIGAWDDLKIYNRALTAAEIQRDKNTPPNQATTYDLSGNTNTALTYENGATAIYNMDEANGTVVNDNSGGNNEGRAKENGLVGYWDLNDVFGTTAIDNSGNNYHGTVYGSAIAPNAYWPLDDLAPTGDYSSNGNTLTINGTTSVVGKYKEAKSFNGTASDYLEIADSGTLDLAGAFTLSLWVKTASGGKALITKLTGSPYDGWAFRIGPTGVLQTYLKTWVSGTTNVADNNWHYVAFVYNGNGTGQFYVDGNTDGSAVSGLTTPTNTTQSVKIGHETWYTTEYPMNGSIDEVRAYGSALSQAQIQADMNRSYPQVVSGKYGNARSLLYTNKSEIVIPENDAFDPASLTLGAWVYISSEPSTNLQIVGKGSNSGYRYRINSNRSVTFFDRGATNMISTSSGAVPLNTWTHVAATAGSGGLAIYINGVSAASNAVAYGAPNNASPFTIGNNCNTCSEFMDGIIDEVRVYNYAMTQAGIQAMMNKTTRGPQVIAGQSATFGNARSFDGSGDSVLLNNESNFDFERTNSFSIEAWIKTTSSGTYPVIFSKLNNVAPYTGYEFSLNTTGKLRFIAINDKSPGTNWMGKYGNTSVNDGAWHHVAVTYSGTSNVSGINFYVDGNLESNPTTEADVLSASILNNISPYIGSRNNNPVYFNGSIDDLRVYNRALTQAEIQQNMAEPTFGPQIIDSTSGHNQAKQFNGLNDYLQITSNANLRPAKNFTVEAWINFDDCNDNRVIMKHSDNGGGDDCWGLRISTNCKVQINASNANGFAAQSLESDETLTPGTWYHVAGVYTSDNVLKTYVNAGTPTTKQASGDVVYSDTTGGVIIGRRGGVSAPNTLYFKGKLDDVRFFNYERTQEDIALDMAETLPAYKGSGTIQSTNILSGSSNVDGLDEFTYVLSSLPTGSTASIQFSQDASNWYNSSGALNGTNSLTAGTNTINIHNLTWSGANFYYKTTMTSNGTVTPVLGSISLNYTTGGYSNTNTSTSDIFAPVTSSTGLSYGVNKVQLSYSGEEGDGIDGAITVGANTSINSANLISGRSCTDVSSTGGDAPFYSVTALTSTTATVSPTPTSACLKPGDEILLINLQGGGAGNVTNVGNYETLKIGSISGNTITFATSKTKYYGDGADNDTNLGSGATNQKVLLQRVPHYSNVTVNGGYSLYPDTYYYPSGRGGVIFFRANGTVSVAATGSINANAKGYAGGAGGTVNTNGAAGPGYPGQGLFYTTGTEGVGGAYGTAGNTGTYSGGGGTGGSSTANGGSGTNNVGAGGGGGGGAAYQASGCGGRSAGGGGGGFASGGGGGASAATNGNGTGGDTSNSGAGGKGGGACSGINLSGAGGGGAGNYGLANLTKLNFGSGGGGAGGAGATVGTGGRGGGIIQIYGSTINVSGSITSTGGSGNNGSGGYWNGCGGGGAGGSIKLVGGSVTLGTNLVTAAGGDGGAAGLCAGYQYGGTGGNGRIAVGGSSVSGSTSPSKTDISALSTGTFATTGNFVSKNLLANLSGVTSITSFTYTLATKPANTTAVVQFSQDNNNWYNSSGENGGTNTLDTGSNTISLTGLSWYGPYFYYKVTFTSNGSATPSLTAASVNYNTATSVASSTWAVCTPLPGKNWTIGNNCFMPKTGYDISHRNIDGVDDGNLTVSAYKTLTIKGDQIIARNNGKQINVQGTLAINDIPIGGVGGNVRDYSGNNNEGFAVGSTIVAGKYGKARYFNGTSDHLSVANSTPFQLTSAFTVEAWVYADAAPGSQGRTVLSTYTYNSGGSTQTGWNFGAMWTGTNFRFEVHNGDQHASAPDASFFTDKLGQWVHVAGVFVPSTGVYLYENGELVASDTTDIPSAPSYGATDLLIIGRRSGNAQSYFQGKLDDVRIYNYARSVDQIKEDMNYAPNPTGNIPLAWYRFEDGGQIKETNLWSEDNDGDGWTMTFETQDKAQNDAPATGWVRRKDTVGSVFGTGKDGSVTFTTNTNLSTWNHTGRTCDDGGEAVSYNITAFGTDTADNSDTVSTATLSSTPSSGCLAAGDNVLIINAQGTASAYGNTGNYELMKIYSISGTSVKFTSLKKKNYGDGANDTNLGTATSNQRVIMQRIPQFQNVTVNTGVTLTANAWNGTKGGIVALMATGTLANSGTISANELGYRGNTGATSWVGGLGGETYNGYAGKGYDGGGAGGAGGGGTRASGTTNMTGTVGGAGGGGGARWGGGGGAGFVTVGAGGHGASGYDGASGSGATGGNGGGGGGNVGGGGGGGGTYGDASLAQIFFGSAGGADGNSSSADGCWENGGTSGSGGGIVFLMTKTLTNSGTISAKGRTSVGTPCTTNGSGTGGSIKIFASTATLGTMSAIAGTAGPTSSVGRVAVGAESTSGSSTPAFTAITKP